MSVANEMSAVRRREPRRPYLGNGARGGRGGIEAAGRALVRGIVMNDGVCTCRKARSEKNERTDNGKRRTCAEVQAGKRLGTS